MDIGVSYGLEIFMEMVCNALNRDIFRIFHFQP